MDRLVKGACKPKRAAPKGKYIDPIVQATFAHNGSLQEVIRLLGQRVQDDNPTVAFKALIVLHALMRSGEADMTFTTLTTASLPFGAGNYGRSAHVRAYALYLDQRLKSYATVNRDVVRDKQDKRANAHRLRSLSVDKGLLRETREVQRIIAKLVEAKFYLDDTNDDVAMSALRFCVTDLLLLFQTVNEGVINVLEHYFEMSQVDAATALKIYKTFCKDAESVVNYLSVAKRMSNIIGVQVPNLKHAPVSLGQALEEYLNSPEFEKNRQEYKENKRIADGKTPSKPVGAPAKSATSGGKASEATSSSSGGAGNSSGGGGGAPANNDAFRDFFESIEESQTSMFNPNTGNPTTGYFNAQAQANPFGVGPFGQMMPQQTGFMPHQTGLMPQATGMGMAAFGRMGSMGSFSGPSGPPSMMGSFSGPSGAPSLMGSFSGPSGRMPSISGPGIQPQATGFMQPQQTMQPQQAGFMQPQPTGMNPFRQSMAPGMLQAQPTGAMYGFSQAQVTTPPPARASLGSQAFSSPFASAPFSANAPTAQAPTQPQPMPTSQPQPPAQQQQQPPPPPLPQQQPTSPVPQPLFAQSTGSRNPFAPLQTAQEPAKPPPQPSMRDLAFSRQPQPGGLAPVAEQQQQQPSQQPTFPQQPFQPQQQTSAQTNGVQPQPTGMGSIASDFVFHNNNSPSSPAPPASSTPAFSNAFSAPTSTASSLAPLTTSFNQMSFTSSAVSPTSQAAPAPLQAQPTGFGGSLVKPFQPSSSFGAAMQEEFARTKSASPQPAPQAVPASQPAQPAAPQQAQPSGLPPSGFQTSGLQPQPTGSFNPFRPGGAASPPPQWPSSSAGAGWPSSSAAPFNAFSSTPFGSQQQQQQQQQNGVTEGSLI